MALEIVRPVVGVDAGWDSVVARFNAFARRLAGGDVGRDLEIVPQYTLVHDICLQGSAYAASLYDRVEPLMSNWIRNDLVPRCRWGPILHAYVRMYREFALASKYMTAVFRYLDQHHVLREKLAPVTAVCLACFREHVHNALSGSVISAILEQLAEFRANAPVSFSVLSDAVHVFMSVADNGSVYYDDLEPVLLRSASSFYDSEFVNRLLSSGNASSYLHAVAAILSKELDNAKLWLPDDSVDRLRGLLHERLLAQTFSSLLGGSGFSQMLLEGNTRDIALVYDLYANDAACVEELATKYMDYVVAKGKQLDQRSEIVAKLIDLQSIELRRTVQTCFQNSIRFHRALHDAMETLLSMIPNGTLLVAQHLDAVLSRVTMTSEDEISAIVSIVSCLRLEKDFFAMHPARASEIGWSSANFEEEPLRTRLGSAEVTARVITTGSWPRYSQEDDILPCRPILPALSALEGIYAQVTSGRRLRWVHSLGGAVLVGNCLRARPEISVSTPQAAILLQLNSADSIQIGSLPASTGASANLIKRALRLMCTGKLNILSKDPVQGYSVTDRIRVNTKFQAQSRRISIALAAETSGASPEADAETKKVVAEDRRHVVEAFIVRLLKRVKSMSMAELLSALATDAPVNCRPDPSTVPAIVDDLVSREYLHRDGANPSLLHYNAY
ncbi:unnamed protein product (mitochondrion) [Plasmodiophora brassicae]|uniref:Cullin family profile domain-containing protein n=1 Tax=Plasmodiophora brassicae TaxID=37360 RepID=A0A3P3Y7J2_PLABS|nr:unnamed protein product [Plasmodiophora brassicae]